MLNNKTKKNVKVRRAKTFKKSKNIKRNNTYNKQHGGVINTTTLDHYWFTEWPDHGVPDQEPYKTFIEQLYEYIKNREQDLNMIIHCSAGVGRTGTVYITLYLLSKYGGIDALYKKNDAITAEIIIDAIKYARLHRVLIVQTEVQFKFLCEIFGAAFNIINLSKEYKDKYSILFSNISSLPPQNAIATSLKNKKKNRYTNILPYEHSSVKLKLTKNNPDGYINASLMPRLQINNIFVNIIAAQGPIKESTQDFLRMCVEQRISLIVMVTGLTEGGQDKCYNYFGDLKDNAKDSVFNKYEIECDTENNNVCTPTYIPNTIFKPSTTRKLGLSRENIIARRSGKKNSVINTNKIFGTNKNQSGTTRNNTYIYGKLGNPTKGIPLEVDGKSYIFNKTTNTKPETQKQSWWSKMFRKNPTNSNT